MDSSIFNARLLQIQIDRDAINAEIVGMESDNLLRAQCNESPAWSGQMFNECRDNLLALSRGIDNLINQYQEGAASPALSMSEDDIIDAFDAYTCQAKFLNGNQNEATVVAYSDICLIVKDIYAKLEGAGK